MAEVHVVSTSPEDDAAFVALEDISRLLTEKENGCIIGGHMVSLLSARYPSNGFIDRRTGDADAGIPVQLAQTGSLHNALLAAGYEARNGNRYVMPGKPPKPTIDLLAPAWSHTFEPQDYGGRSFDTMPGLPLALSAPITFSVIAMMRDGSERTFCTRVPTVEAAIVLKANAWGSRVSTRDAVDLHNLFCIVRAGHAIGTWRLDEPNLIGTRLDAARHLHALADAWESRPPLVRFDTRLLVSGIRRNVTRV